MVIRKSQPHPLSEALPASATDSLGVGPSTPLSTSGEGSGLVLRDPASTGGAIGRFELIRRLGQGGEGTVYEARDRRGGLVALKQLHPARVASGASLKREFRALADVVHPNLVGLRELFHEQGQWFYTMDLVSGVNFVRHVRPALQALHVARLRAALWQLLSGLGALHAAGKLHRDLKPSNVLVRSDGHLVILDFGLVVDQTDGGEVQPGWERIAGTPAYAAPEQAAGRAEPASDLYAVGVMLFQALTGGLPFDGQRPAGASYAQPVRPSECARDVPPDLDALCMRLLSVDPAARPTVGEALALCTAAGSAAPHPAQAAPARPGNSEWFVGRETLLSELATSAAQAQGAPVLVLLRGESGIGKSALLAQFCAQRAECGALVLSGRCYEREHLPYKALDAIVERLVQHLNGVAGIDATLAPDQLAALVRLFPAFARLSSQPAEPAPVLDDAGEVRRRAFAALNRLFAVLGEGREVVFAVDDLQWADLDSIELLEHLLSSQGAPPILLLGVYRTEERHTSPALQAIARALTTAKLQWVELTVGPLAQTEAADLLAALAQRDGALSPAQLEQCLAQASGMPFALHQLVEHARDAAGPPTASEGLLREAVLRRAARCSPGARTLLEVLCVAGRPLETLLALQSCGTADHPGGVGWAAAVELCGKKLARWRDTESARCVEPYHDLIREAVAQATPPERERQIHRNLVDALEVRAAECPEYLVEHLRGAGEQARAGRMALAAAERAQAQLAWNRTIELLTIALSSLDAEELARHDVKERLAAACASSSRHREAASAYTELAGATADRAERQRLEALAAQQLMRAGDAGACVALVRKLLGEIGYRYPRSLSVAMATYAWNRLRQRVARLFRPRTLRVRPPASAARMRVLATAYNELWQTEPLRASVIHTWFFREARRCADRDWLRAQVWEIVHVAVRYGAKGEQRVARMLAEAEQLSAETMTPHETALQYLARAVYLTHCRCWPREALHWLDAADERFRSECPGSHFERGWIAILREIALELTGGLADIVEGVAVRERLGVEQANGYSSSQLLITVPLARIVQDRPDAALAFVNEHWERPKHLTIIDFAIIARKSTALLYAGDAEAASACLLREWRALWWSGVFSIRTARESAYYHRMRNAVALYWRTRDPRLAHAAERWTARADRLPAIPRGLYRVAAASLARADGQNAVCRALLCDAMTDFDLHGAQAAAWCTRYRLAQLDRSSEQLARARAWFSASGVRCPERWVALTIPGEASDWT